MVTDPVTFDVREGLGMKELLLLPTALAVTKSIVSIDASTRAKDPQVMAAAKSVPTTPELCKMSTDSEMTILG